MKLRPYTTFKGTETVGYHFWCPGCKAIHGYAIKLYSENGNPVWSFNGNVDAPTFTPSLLVQWRNGEGRAEQRCHLYLTDGKLNFLSDCTHALAGQTVDLPEWPLHDAP